MKKIFPKKYYNIVFAFSMASMMSWIMSAFITYKNLWLVSNFIPLWLQAWGLAFIVWLPIALFVVPIVRKFVDKITY